MQPRSPIPGSLTGLVVFFSSFAVMSLELSAARLCMPYFGSSVFVWGILISVVLAALSLGYWIGGLLADRGRPERVLAMALLSGAAWVGGAALLAPSLLRRSAQLGEITGTLVVITMLFLVPMLGLGAVSPSVLKLKIRETDTVGRVSGGVFVVSSLGSIVGTLTTTFLLVPFAGSVRSVGLVALVLGILGLLVLGAPALRRLRGAPLVVLLLPALASAQPPRLVAPLPGERFATETPYSYIRVVEQRGHRFLLLNTDQPFQSFNSVLVEGHLTGHYYDYLAMAPSIPPEPRRVLILGMGGGTNARALLALYPELTIDAVEIDPGVVEAARRHFGVEEGPRLRIHTAGARAFLVANDERYDVIIMDVFQDGPHIPFHLVTREFHEEIARHLAPEGVLAANVAFVGGSVMNAMLATFGHVRYREMGLGVVAFATRGPIDFGRGASDERIPPALRPAYHASLDRWQRWRQSDDTVFTDDRAAVELTTALARRRATRHAPPPEELSP